MQFKHPEFLYGLLLLLIPLFIHLFQLRKFQKVRFTNVKFLKQIEMQTRKSSQLKKWLILATRMLLLAAIVLAFTQPYLGNKKLFLTEKETVLYIDNSFSMQAKGTNGNLLNEAIQDLINTLEDDETISLFTNNGVYRNTSLKAIKNELIKLPYSNTQIDYNSALLKGKQLFSKSESSEKHLILVSDFQLKKDPFVPETDPEVQVSLVQLKPNSTNNINIDSLFITPNENNNLSVNVVLKNQGDTPNNVPISLYNNENLVAKSGLDFDTSDQVIFSIPKNVAFNGKITIEDSGLQYDNSLYFNLNKKAKIKVLCINGGDDDFLRNLYTNDEFDYLTFQLDRLNYNLITDQNLIVINGLNDIPNSLITALSLFYEDGGSILIIPSNNCNLNSYNQLLSKLKLPSISEKIETETQITSISYDHPILTNAFYNRVSNFQYPKVTSYYRILESSNSILKFQDGSDFLNGQERRYLFASSLDKKTSNFQDSPLIVPVLYNIGLQSLKLSKLYYTIGNTNVISIPVRLIQDEILTLKTSESAVVPLQQTFTNKVEITTNDYPNTAGILEVMNRERFVENLSFNYARDESILTYNNFSDLNDISIQNNLESTILSLKTDVNSNALWKWFIIFALVLLLIEMLILKYFR